MDYQEAIERLYGSVPAFHAIGPGAYKPGLATSRLLDDWAGNPHRRYPTVHIAGTNGKGSTAHTLAAILTGAGYRTGLYTSPHIYDFRERIRVDGEMISQAEVTDFVERWLAYSELNPEIAPSFFELTSTMAFEHFSRRKVDVAIIETGLGGRLDSTNIITPVLSVITNISLDHTALLGDTLTAIAGEKAGIIKPGVPVVIGESVPETAEVFEKAARTNNSPIHFATPIKATIKADGNLYPSTPYGPIDGELRGECQARNAATILEAVKVLKETFTIPDHAVREGMEGVSRLTHLFGRWSKIADRPTTVCDTGHNQGGWELLVDELAAVDADNKHLVIGFVADKDLSHILPLVGRLKGEVELWFSSPSCERGLDASVLADRARRYGLNGEIEPDVNKAVERARADAGDDGFVLVAGSNFLIADLNLNF